MASARSTLFLDAGSFDHRPLLACVSFGRIPKEPIHYVPVVNSVKRGAPLPARCMMHASWQETELPSPSLPRHGATYIHTSVPGGEREDTCDHGRLVQKVA